MPGTAPTGWQAPKTNYTAADAPVETHFNRIEGNAQAIEQGSRTIDPTQIPAGNIGTLRNLLDWLANRVQTITGGANWWTAPVATLSSLLDKFGVLGHTHNGSDGEGPQIGTTGLSNNAVTLAKMAQVATARFLGRVTSGTGNVEALDVDQMQSALGIESPIRPFTVAPYNQVSVGDVVELLPEGVRPLKNMYLGTTTLETTDNILTSTAFDAILRWSESVVMYVYRLSGSPVALLLQATTINPSTGVTTHTAPVAVVSDSDTPSMGARVLLAKVGSTLVMVYSKTSSTTGLYARAATFNGSTFSFGAEATISAGGNPYGITALDSTKCLVKNMTNGVWVLTISGTSISVGAQYNVVLSGLNYGPVCAISPTKVLFFARDVSVFTNVRVCTLTISGTTVTASATRILEGSVEMLVPTPYPSAVKFGTDTVLCFCYGGIIKTVGEVTDVSGYAERYNGVAVGFDGSTLSGSFSVSALGDEAVVCTHVGSSSAPDLMIYHIDPKAGVMEMPAVTRAIKAETLRKSGTAGMVGAAYLNRNVLVAVMDSQKSGLPYVDTCIVRMQEDMNPIGIALTAATGGNTCQVQTDGVYTTIGLSAGKQYYCDANGHISTETSPLCIGTALSGTKLALAFAYVSAPILSENPQTADFSRQYSNRTTEVFEVIGPIPHIPKKARVVWLFVRAASSGSTNTLRLRLRRAGSAKDLDARFRQSALDVQVGSGQAVSALIPVYLDSNRCFEADAYTPAAGAVIVIRVVGWE